MAKRTVDPRRFLLLGSFTDWVVASRQRANEQVESAAAIAKERGLRSARLLQLRWVADPALGYPSAPFTVWRRRSNGLKTPTVGFSTTSILGLTFVVLDRPCVYVSVSMDGPGGAVLAFAGMPYSSSMLTPQVAAAGPTTVGISGSRIQTLVVPSGTSVLGITGIDAATVDDPAWEQIEIVGLPSDGRFAGVQRLDAPQGLTGALGDPDDAARDRFRRGAPFYGWDALMQPAKPAPTWTLADDRAMIRAVHDTMLDPLLDMVTSLPARQHQTYTVNHTLTTSTGQAADASFSPLRVLLYGAATDPLASLITGYGTAYEVIAEPGSPFGSHLAASVGPATAPVAYDYMVTADYDKGTLSTSASVVYAALLLNPRGVLPPPTPTSVSVNSDGMQAPVVTDGPWRTVDRISWDRVSETLPFQIGSFALARQALAPAGGVEPLMDKRMYDTALQPIAATISSNPATVNRMAALDERYQIASSPNPNALLYGVAMQDLFGTWSRWATTTFAVGEPPPGPATILSTRLDTSAATGLCPGTLVVELSWDWANRSPASIDLVGRRYGQGTPAERPADLSIPASLPASLTSGSGAIARIEFAAGGQVSAVTPGGGLSVGVEYVSLDGLQLVTTPVTNHGPRRYRVTATGLQLDFSSAPMIGVATWARGTEAVFPQRVGPWSAEPSVASASDPRPPVMSVEHEDVLMTSLGDASGEHHAMLSWPAAPGAAGYFAYTVAESKFRADRGLGEPATSLTLSQRLAELRNLHAANPDRRSFTRVNATVVPGTSMQITLPRGTKEIHLFVVLAVSAGQVESSWPGLSDPLRRKRPIAYAAPQVVRPSPPSLEVTRVLDSSVLPPRYRASVRVQTSPGATVGRVDLHRVRVPDAATELDTMGPPVAQLTGSSGAFTVTPRTSTEPGESQLIGTITGNDGVEGSWKPVYYRAVAWGTDDPTRGQYGGRSEPSAPRSVLVPPADPPQMSAVTYLLPTLGSADARIDLSTAAPVAPTALGPHRIEVEVITEHPDGSSETTFVHPAPVLPPDPDTNRLELLATTGPGSGLSGAWRDSTSAGTTPLHVLVRRSSFADVLRARIRLTDPLGRLTERTIVVPTGSPIIAPDIISPTITVVPAGRIFTFKTSVPAQVGGQPYRLKVSYAQDRVPPLRRGRTHRFDVALASIRRFRRGENIFADATIPVPARRTARRRGLTTITLGLRGAGVLTVTIVAPDATTATLTRTIGRGA